jgi:hypothetical protein
VFGVRSALFLECCVWRTVCSARGVLYGVWGVLSCVLCAVCCVECEV